MPARPFTRTQTRQNARFLRALARTGNARLAAEELNVNRSTYTRRRALSPRFATLWDAALAFAHATLNSPSTPSWRGQGGGPLQPNAPRARGNEPLLLRLANGRVQLRRAPRGRMTKAAEQAFLAALAATCNVRLSAAAAGFTHSAFYQKAVRDPGFAREMRLALIMGHKRLEAALLEGFLPASHEDDAWRHNDPLPIPAMTPGQAIQLLSLHNRSVNDSWDKPHRRRRRAESDETHRYRLMTMWASEKRREAELRMLAELPDEPDEEPEDGEGIAALPQLDQVTGWSGAKPHLSSEADAQRPSAANETANARPTGPQGGARSTSRDNGPLTDKLVWNPDRAMFGGWRIGNWKKRSG